MNKERNFSITGHMVVKNEDRWIWFSIMSVIDFLDELIIFDTGSKDHTTDIIEEILEDDNYRDKVIYKKIGDVSACDFCKVRQQQIEMTKTDYFMVIDGDEIWYKESLKELQTLLENKPLLVATRFINACRDVYHYRFDSRESYCINGETGAITIRVYSMKIPGISCGGIYGVEGFVDDNGNSVQEHGYGIVVQNGKYFHTSLLNRSSIICGDYSIKYRRKKFGIVWDDKFSPDFSYPEIFYAKHFPKYVKTPFIKDCSIIRDVYYVLSKLKKMYQNEKN